MPPVEIGQVTGITDFLQPDHFSFLIPVLPGGGDSEAFHIRNLTAILPGRANQVVQGEMHRFKINRAGKPIYQHTFTATYMDATDKKILDGIQAWQNMVNNPETGLPNPSDMYMTTGLAMLYDMNNRVVERREFHNLWISNFQDLSLDGASASMARFSIQFTYDYWLRR